MTDNSEKEVYLLKELKKRSREFGIKWNIEDNNLKIGDEEYTKKDFIEYEENGSIEIDRSCEPIGYRRIKLNA